MFTDIRPHILGQVKLNKSFTDTLLGRIFGFESDAHHIIISSRPLEYELRTQASSQNERTVVLTQIRRGFATSHTYLIIAYHIIFDICILNVISQIKADGYLIFYLIYLRQFYYLKIVSGLY